jgi:hypothetical protein
MHRNFTATVALNTGCWLDETLAMVPEGSRLPEDFHLELLASFFTHFTSMLRTGKHDFLHGRHAVKEELLYVIVADVEAGFKTPSGMHIPGEIEPDEMEIVVRIMSWMYDDLMSAVDYRCLDCTATFEFTRLAGSDVLFSYHSERHPYAFPGPRQLSLIHRSQELYHDIAPPRRWA